MIAVNFSTFRKYLKDYCDKVTDEGETLLITRRADKNVVVISTERYNASQLGQMPQPVAKKPTPSQIGSLTEAISSKLDSMIFVLQASIDTLQGQLAVKDRLIEQQAQIIVQLTDALSAAQRTTAAAQALHAGMIHQQLLPGETRDDPPAPEAGAEPDLEQKQSWISRQLKKKKGKRMA